MSRVFLLSSNVATEPYPVYPLGMAIIAAALQRCGHELRQFDMLVHQLDGADVGAAVREFKPDFICVSLRNIDNVDSFSSDENWYLNDARLLIERLRRHSDAPVIIGGPAFSIMPQQILDFVAADYGICGEGEQALVELIDALKQGRAMPRVYSGAAPIAGAAMISPLLVPEYVDYYQQHSGMVNLQSKRGCPYRCVYCTYPALEGSSFRLRQPGAVVDDMERLRRDFGSDHIFFTDSTFNDHQGHYLELVEEIIRRDLKLRWCAFFRPQGLNDTTLALLKRSGLYAMEMGTDAACDRTLAGLDKGFTFAEVLRCHQSALRAQIPCAHFIMFGGPDETPDSVDEGLDNIARLENTVVFAFSGIRILPRSRLHRRAIDDGVISADTSLLKPVYYLSPKIDREWMNMRILKSFAGQRNRIFPPSKGQEQMRMMNNFGFKGILWDQMVSFTAGRRRRPRRRPRHD